MSFLRAKTALTACFIASAVLFANPFTSFAQQYLEFVDVVGTPTGEFGWDGFTGNYSDAHAPDAASSGVGTAFLSVTPDPDVVAGFDGPGGIVGPPGLPGDLYAHDTTPVYSLDLGSLETSGAFTSVAVQFAITKSFLPPTSRFNLTAASFELDGVGGPDEFEFLGPLAQIPGNSGPEDIDYFWAEWNRLAAGTDLDFTITGSLGQFQTLTAAKVSYFNGSDANFNISFVPEPSAGILPLLFGLTFLKRRRN